MSTNNEHQRPWVATLALVLSFLAAVVTFFGAIVTYVSQAQVAQASLWPLPGLVLLDWLVIGVVSFISVFFSLRRKTVGWLRLTWLLTGAYIPLIILGAFSIGLLVMLAFFLAVISTFIIAIRHRSKWLESFGLLMLGSISNLVILALMIEYAGSGVA
jgi:hypothetical protein